MKTDADEKLWDYYQRENSSYFDTTCHDKITMIARFIENNTKTTDHLCEVGLGNGLMLLNLFRKRHVIGIDLCQGTIDHLSSRPEFSRIELRHGNICELSHICENNDAIITIDVIEHLNSKDLETAFREVHSSLKVGGKWFINVPWNENLRINEIFCPHCHQTFHRVGHKQSFNEARLSNLLRGAGFDVVQIKKIYPANVILPRPLLWLYRLIAKIYLKNFASMFAIAVKL